MNSTVVQSQLSSAFPFFWDASDLELVDKCAMSNLLPPCRTSESPPLFDGANAHYLADNVCFQTLLVIVCYVHIVGIWHPMFTLFLPFFFRVVVAGATTITATEDAAPDASFSHSSFPNAPTSTLSVLILSPHCTVEHIASEKDSNDSRSSQSCHSHFHLSTLLSSTI